MKKIGLIGGVGWPSTIDYYRIINETANKQASNLTSPDIIIYSLNFEPLMKLQYSDQWSKTAIILADAANNLAKAGADFAVICSVTTNIPFEEVQQMSSIPILSIIDPIAKAIKEKELLKIGLIGTMATMEHDFFRSGLERYDIECIVPQKSDRKIIHDVIYNELCVNDILSHSKKEYLRIIETLSQKGAEGIILGCTEIPMLISKKDISLPTFEVTELHALEALRESEG